MPRFFLANDRISCGRELFLRAAASTHNLNKLNKHFGDFFHRIRSAKEPFFVFLTASSMKRTTELKKVIVKKWCWSNKSFLDHCQRVVLVKTALSAFLCLYNFTLKSSFNKFRNKCHHPSFYCCWVRKFPRRLPKCFMDVYTNKFCDISSWTLQTKLCIYLMGIVDNNLKHEGSVLLL